LDQVKARLKPTEKLAACCVGHDLYVWDDKDEEEIEKSALKDSLP